MFVRMVSVRAAQRGISISWLLVSETRARRSTVLCSLCCSVHPLKTSQTYSVLWYPHFSSSCSFLFLFFIFLACSYCLAFLIESCGWVCVCVKASEFRAPPVSPPTDTHTHTLIVLGEDTVFPPSPQIWQMWNKNYQSIRSVLICCEEPSGGGTVQYRSFL